MTDEQFQKGTISNMAFENLWSIFFFSDFLGLKTDGNKIITTGLESNIDSHLTKQKYL